MPTRTRHARSSAAEVLEPEEEQGGLRRIRFNKPLSWRAGQTIPVADLLQRLEELALELRQLDQEETDKDHLAKVSQQLANGHLLAHRDKGVRAWTACCAVDVLRLCAPTAPFTENQLKDIFTCIITSIIPALADPSNAYNDQHVYVLSSLAEVKSIVLITDVAAPDTLILPLFSNCFDIVSGSSKSSTGEELAKNVEYDMTRLLVPVIDEASVLAPEVIDVIMAQFLRVDPRVFDQPTGGKNKKHGHTVDAKQETLLLKEYPPAYNMAKAICSACPDKMTNYVSQYFNNVIIDASGSSGANGTSKHSAHRRVSLDDSDDEGENIKELSKAHRLIREIWRACPDVLQNVIPQLEVELSAESVSLRLLATQTIGDLAAGIGVAGPPPPASMDPAAYPPVKLTDSPQGPAQQNVLLTPLSPKPFSQAHSSAYESFLSRRQDRSASMRAAWATAVGRILLTSAGGVGLSSREEQTLVDGLTRMLGDADEKVRAAAVGVIGKFGFSDIIKKLGAYGGLADEGSILAILADRAKDRKHVVREPAMKLLARMWGVAAGEIEQNNEQVISILQEVPSRLLDTYYTNNQEIQTLLDHVIFECLLPLNYPPIKSKSSKGGSSQARKQKGTGETDGDSDVDADVIRARRILTLVKGLNDRAKKVFFAFQGRQLNMRTFMTFYLTACEEYNGGVMDGDEQAIKAKLSKVIDSLSKMLPDPPRVSADLWKFAKMHDRRNYQLLRFAMAAASDYRTVTKAIRELTKRIQGNTSAPASLLETLMPLVYRSSSLIFNRSHIPAIMDLSRNDDSGLGNTAHEMLRETSAQNPEVLEAHVQDMCKDLESHAPDAKNPDEAGVEEILKACSGFAKKLPAKLPTDRKFFTALNNYALYSSSPRAAKHAVSIIMATSDKKQMYAKDLMKKSVQKWSYGSEHYLTKLATLSQLNLLAPQQADEEADAVISIATKDILLKNRNSKPSSDYTWSDDLDEETEAKTWALKVLVNRVRAQKSLDDESAFRSYAEPVYKILNTLVSNDGELSKSKDTPGPQKSRLRLLAAKLILKLCSSQSYCERMLTPIDFNHLALVAQDPLLNVRSGFIGQLKKRLVQTSHLAPRWYTIAFLLAFEPNANLKDSTLTWLRSRSLYFSRQAGDKKSEHQPVMESVFSRLLSLLAHHPDYPDESIDDSTKVDYLADFARYILFYLTAVGNENNLSLIFHIAQRVKQAKDAISGSDQISTHLHTLSDLAQATIRLFAEVYSQQHKIGGTSGSGAANILQTYPGKMRLPSALFANLSSHSEAQSIAEKNFLPEEVDDKLERIVRSFMKPKSNNLAKKRKAEADGGANDASGGGKRTKKEKTKTLPFRRSSLGATAAAKPAKRRKTDEDEWEGVDRKAGGEVSASRRRSGRGAKRADVSYAEGGSDDDEEQMEDWNQEAEAEEDEDEGGEPSGDENDQEEQSSTIAPDEDVASQDEDGDSAMTNSDQASSRAPSKRRTSARGRRVSTSPVAVKGKRSSKQQTTKAPLKESKPPARRSTRSGR